MTQFARTSGARLKEIQALLKGTIAEAKVHEQHQLLGQLRKASLEEDPAQIREIGKQLKTVGRQLEQMLAADAAMSKGPQLRLSGVAG